MFESEMFCTRGVPIKATVYSQKEPSLCIIPFKYMYVYLARKCTLVYVSHTQVQVHITCAFKYILHVFTAGAECFVLKKKRDGNQYVIGCPESS